MSLDLLLECAAERRLLWLPGPRAWMLPLWPASEEGALVAAVSALCWPGGQPERIGMQYARPELLRVEATDTRVPMLEISQAWTARADWAASVVELAERLAVAKRWHLRIRVAAVRGVVDHVEAVRGGCVHLHAHGRVPMLPLTSMAFEDAELPRWGPEGWTDEDQLVTTTASPSADHAGHGDHL